MAKLTQKQIIEIAEQLDCGFLCYVDKSNNEVLFIPNQDSHSGMELDAWKDDLKKIRKNRDKYCVIEPPTSSDSFKIMADFVDALDDGNTLKAILIHALERRKPFAEFKYAIDNSGDFRQKWFDFKNKKLQEWVTKEFDYLDDDE